jgi:hypothetical protein
MRRMLVRAAVATALFTVIAPVFAKESLAERDTWPTELTKRPLTLAAGMVELWAPLQVNASDGADWKPVTSNPSIAFGITDEWMIGVRHLVGLCFGGADDGCPNVYNDTGVFSRVSLMRGSGLDIAVQGGFDVTRWAEPMNYAAHAGLLLRAGGGALALTAEPSVSFGLNDRDVAGRTRTTAFGWNMGTYDVLTPEETFGNNKEHLSVPVTLQLQLGSALALVAGASLEGPLNPPSGQSFADLYRIPVGAGVVFTLLKTLDVGATFTFPSFAGNDDTRDLRQIAVFLAARI